MYEYRWGLLKMKNKLLCLIMILTLILSILCGCSVDVEINENSNSTDSNTESTPTESSATDTNTSQKEEVTISAVEEAYNTAINLTKSDLSIEYAIGDFNTWMYRGISLTYEDCEFINDARLNPKGLVNQDALYCSLAETIADLIKWDAKNKNISYKDDAKILFGEVPESQEEFIKRAKQVSSFITSNDSMTSILEALENCEGVNGTFDYANNKFDFIITDVSECAANLGVSEDVLGYMLAFFNMYPADITFENNSCIFSLTVKKYDSVLDN